MTKENYLVNFLICVESRYVSADVEVKNKSFFEIRKKNLKITNNEKLKKT
ncbi:hypothetical protein CAPN010_19110 [Capnocytophaga cynodegmi]|nr:hypothetical protein [Capnocytophaga cynodegmi]GJQ07753.1 hypothetical protein CAPN010_19110 [Capnocytophaga cynodegmi]